MRQVKDYIYSIGLEDPKEEYYEDLYLLAQSFVNDGYTVFMRPKNIYNAFVVLELTEDQALLLDEIQYDILLVRENVLRILYTDKILKNDSTRKICQVDNGNCS